jgi:hypothetical protein
MTVSRKVNGTMSKRDRTDEMVDIAFGMDAILTSTIVALTTCGFVGATAAFLGFASPTLFRRSIVEACSLRLWKIAFDGVRVMRVRPNSLTVGVRGWR